MGWSVRKSPGQTNSISQVGGALSIVPIYWLCGGGLSKGAMASDSTSVWEKATPPAVARKFLLIHSWFLLSCCPWCFGAQNEWVWVSPCMGPLRGRSGTPAALSHSAIIPASFYSPKLCGFIFLALEPWAGEEGLIWDWNLSFLSGDFYSQDNPPNFYPSHMGGGTRPFCVFTIPTSFNKASSLYP